MPGLATLASLGHRKQLPRKLARFRTPLSAVALAKVRGSEIVFFEQDLSPLLCLNHLEAHDSFVVVFDA